MKSLLGQRVVTTLVIVLVVIPSAAFCLILGLVGFGIAKASMTNNQILGEYEQEFYQVSHPPHTSLIAFNRKVLNPPGNGDHCFYFVGEVRSFVGDRSFLEAFYANQPVQIAFLENQQVNKTFPYELDRVFARRIFFLNSAQSLYIVYRLETKIDDYNNFDLRCG